MELHESELVWYKDEGEGVDSSIPLQDIATVDTCESTMDKPNCLLITLVVRSDDDSIVEQQEGVYVRV